MIEWLTGLAILGGIAVYNNYKTKKEVKHAIEAIDNDIEAAKEDIERIERNQNEYFNNKKLSDWTLRHASVIKTLKSINPDLLQEFSMENKSLDKILTIIEEKEEYRNKFNERYISNELNKHEKYFNDIFPDESLTVEQRHAIVKDEDVNYINAGAGTGKTTTILAKIKYLVEKKNVKEQEILLLAYNTAVSVDINKKLEKMNLPKVKAQTFHGFGNQIVKQKYNKEEQHAPEPFIRKDRVGYIVIDNYLKDEVAEDLYKFFNYEMPSEWWSIATYPSENDDNVNYLKKISSNDIFITGRNRIKER